MNMDDFIKMSDVCNKIMDMLTEELELNILRLTVVAVVMDYVRTDCGLSIDEMNAIVKQVNELFPLKKAKDGMISEGSK